MHHHNCHQKNKQNVTVSEKNGPMEFFVEVKGESVFITCGDVELTDGKVLSTLSTKRARVNVQHPWCRCRALNTKKRTQSKCSCFHKDLGVI